MTQLRRLFRNPAVTSLLLSIGVFALVAGARELGLLQHAEFLAYDKFLAWRAGPDTVDDRIVIVEITENDIAKYDFPIPDDLLARLLETIASAKPIAIGLDLYRDVAVPRDGSRLAALNSAFQQNQNIVGIFKFGDAEHAIKISPAPALAENPERFGFNDFPFELGAVRRGFLFLWDTKTTFTHPLLWRLRYKRGSPLTRKIPHSKSAKPVSHAFDRTMEDTSARRMAVINSCSTSRVRENLLLTRLTMFSAIASTTRLGMTRSC